MNKSTFSHLKYLLFLLSIVQVLIFPAHATNIGIFDVDGTLLDDEAEDSLWKTPWILERIDSPTNAAQLTEELYATPLYVEVTPAEYYLNIELFARGDSVLGQFDQLVLKPDPFLNRPAIINPAYYRVTKKNITYRYYKTGISGENYLLQNYLEAKQRAAINGIPLEKIFGRAFKIFVNLASKPKSIIYIVSARDQSKQEYLEFLTALTADGLFPQQALENITSGAVIFNVVPLEGLDSLFTGPNLAKNKFRALREIVLYESNFTSGKTLDYAPNPRIADTLVRTHTFIVAENDPVHLKSMLDTLSALSTSYSTRHSKYILFNAGSSQVRAKSLPEIRRQWSVLYSGLPRDITPPEIELHMPSEPPKQMTSISTHQCTQFLSEGL